MKVTEFVKDFILQRLLLITREHKFHINSGSSVYCLVLLDIIKKKPRLTTRLIRYRLVTVERSFTCFGVWTSLTFTRAAL